MEKSNIKQVNSSETPKEVSSEKLVHDVLLNFNPNFLDYHLVEIKKFIQRPICHPFSIRVEIECPLYSKKVVGVINYTNPKNS